MTREILEELRERLLRQHNVQQMIQARAYEIYQMRGGKPGGEGQDWFHAESEVLAFLIARESAREDEQAETESPVATPAPNAPPKAPAPRKARARAVPKPAAAKEVTPKKSAPKRATTGKPAGSTSKSKKPSKQSKTEESGK